MSQENEQRIRICEIISCNYPGGGVCLKLEMKNDLIYKKMV